RANVDLPDPDEPTTSTRFMARPSYVSYSTCDASSRSSTVNPSSRAWISAGRSRRAPRSASAAVHAIRPASLDQRVAMREGLAEGRVEDRLAGVVARHRERLSVRHDPDRGTAA